MKQRITYTVPNTPQGGSAIHTIIVIDEREDRDWTYFTGEANETLGLPTRWINKREEVA